MKIGYDCFGDELFRSIIKSLNYKDTCDVTNKKETYVYDTNIHSELRPYFEQLLEVFTPISEVPFCDDTNINRVDFIENVLAKWNLFNVCEKDIKKIIVNISANRLKEYPDLFRGKVTISQLWNNDYMNKYCILKNFEWEDFCDDIKYSNRFHSKEVNTEQLGELLKFFILCVSPNSIKLYRSRICDYSHYNNGYLAYKDIGAPPAGLASAGRVNSEGAPCLYLANTDITTYHEVKARPFDHITVGEFTNKEEIRLIDLSKLGDISPLKFEDVDITWFAININIVKKMADEISKPMRRFDKDIDYVPTQYISDYIKSLGYDGIVYKSTIHNGGINYAIFDQSKFECQKCRLVEIKDVEYNTITVS